MTWYVKTEGENTKRHNESIVYHGPASMPEALAFIAGVKYVDDPSVSVEIIGARDLPKDTDVKEWETVCIRGIFRK